MGVGDRARRCRSGLCAVTVALSRRAWEVGLVILLTLIGAVDLFGEHPVPPELDGTLDHLVFRVYGFYIILGSVLILHAIIGWQKTWTRRIERAGMLLTALATGTLLVFLLVDRTAGKYTEYINVHIDRLSIILAISCLTSVARYFFLRHAETMVLRQKVAEERKQLACPDNRGEGGAA